MTLFVIGTYAQLIKSCSCESSSSIAVHGKFSNFCKETNPNFDSIVFGKSFTTVSVSESESLYHLPVNHYLYCNQLYLGFQFIFTMPDLKSYIEYKLSFLFLCDLKVS